MGKQKIKATPIWLPLIRERLAAINTLTNEKEITRIYKWVADAPLWWVGTDMTTLVSDTALNDDEELPPASVPTTSGLMFFAKPVSMVEDYLTTMKLHGNPNTPVGLIGLYWYPTIGDNINVLPLVDTPNRNLQTPVQFTFVGMNRPKKLKRILDAVFLLAEEPHIASVEGFKPAPLDRVPSRYEHQVSRIKTISVRENLESPYERSAEGDKRTRSEYSHRFIVRGFWRNQPYGPNRSLRRRIWVPPFVKGPADKPLVAKTGIITLR